jgi:hypothetical protein
MTTPQTEKKTDVHTEHCCIDHGCKYGDKNCTIVTGAKVQSYPCEECEFELIQIPISYVLPINMTKFSLTPNSCRITA